MLLAVHVRRSTVAAIKDCPIPDQFIGSRSLKQVALQGLCHFQESLRRTALPMGASAFGQQLCRQQGDLSHNLRDCLAELQLLLPWRFSPGEGCPPSIARQ